MDNVKVNIFKNTRKTKDNQPDYRGSNSIAGEYFNIIALWVNKDKNGNDYFSASIDMKALNDFIGSHGVVEPKKDNNDLDINPDELPF